MPRYYKTETSTPGNIPEVHVLEFKKLLFELNTIRPDVQIRLRMLGMPWHPNFLFVAATPDLDNFESSHRATFTDAVQGMDIVVGDVRSVMQFEIDSPFGGYQPHFHYTVRL